MKSEADVEPGFIAIHNSIGATLFPRLAWIAYEKGACGDDVHDYGATPSEAVENLKLKLEELA